MLQDNKDKKARRAGGRAKREGKTAGGRTKWLPRANSQCCIVVRVSDQDDGDPRLNPPSAKADCLVILDSLFVRIFYL